MSRAEEYSLDWVSGVNQRGEPFIQLAKVYKSGKRELIAQLDPWQTRDCALNALSAAEAAQTDAFLLKHMQERIGLDLPGAAAFMAEFRDFRAKLGTSKPTPIEHWNEVMDEMARSRTGKPFDPTKKQ
jgi:hypothetical protein